MPGPWEEGSPGWLNLGDVGGGVGAGKNEKSGWCYFGEMRVGLGSAWV